MLTFTLRMSQPQLFLSHTREVDGQPSSCVRVCIDYDPIESLALLVRTLIETQVATGRRRETSKAKCTANTLSPPLATWSRPAGQLALENTEESNWLRKNDHAYERYGDFCDISFLPGSSHINFAHYSRLVG